MGGMERLNNQIDVKALRKKLGISQDALAAQLGVVGATVRRWESGKSRPSTLALRQLARLQKRV